MSIQTRKPLFEASAKLKIEKQILNFDSATFSKWKEPRYLKLKAEVVSKKNSFKEWLKK